MSDVRDHRDYHLSLPALLVSDVRIGFEEDGLRGSKAFVVERLRDVAPAAARVVSSRRRYRHALKEIEATVQVARDLDHDPANVLRYVEDVACRAMGAQSISPLLEAKRQERDEMYYDAVRARTPRLLAWLRACRTTQCWSR